MKPYQVLDRIAESDHEYTGGNPQEAAETALSFLAHFEQLLDEVRDEVEEKAGPFMAPAVQDAMLLEIITTCREKRHRSPKKEQR